MVDNGDEHAHGESKHSSLVNNTGEGGEAGDKKEDGDDDGENKKGTEEEYAEKRETDGSVPNEDSAKKGDTDEDGSQPNNSSLLGGDAQETVKKTSIMDKLASQ